MNISYDDKADLLYIRLDDTAQEVVNRRLDEDIVLDIGKVVSIEILDASEHTTEPQGIVYELKKTAA
ncbi:MAG: DUF2283 domain-containing protein [Thermodesulfovibrionales bacterium]|nr:DUF2283 domain-containing protein [Thermodesulfovibrionales bacterium]